MIRRVLAKVFGYLRGSSAADRMLPSRGQSAMALGLLSAILTFFAVLGVGLGLAAARIEAGWSSEAAATATLQVFSPGAEMEEQARAALDVLRTTEGVLSVRVVDLAEQERLLEPWVGPDIPIESLPLPLMIEVAADPAALDRNALDARLAVDAPGAVYDDHAAWREPLAAMAGRLWLFAVGCLALVALGYGAALSISTRTTLAANTEAIRTLRLVGARDSFISRAATRPVLLPASAGAAVGTLLGTLLVAALPQASEEGFFLVGIGVNGWQLALPLLVLPVAVTIAWVIAAGTTRRVLRRGV